VSTDNSPSPSRDDRLDDPGPSTSSTRVYTRDESRDRLGRLVVDLLDAYRWPLVLLVVAVVLGVLWFDPEVPDVPPEAQSAMIYAVVGSIFALPAAHYLVKWFDEPSGVAVLDLDPVADDHRHLRVGSEIWDDLEVRSPWGGEASTAELKQNTINGRRGYELMDFRIRDDGTPVAVSTWLGEADSTTLRTYRYAVKYCRERLAERADRAVALEANRHQVVREAAERVVLDMIETAESSGVPSGDKISGVVEQTLDDVGFNDPLDDDRLDDVETQVDRSPDEDRTALDDEPLDLGGPEDLRRAGISTNGDGGDA